MNGYPNLLLLLAGLGQAAAVAFAFARRPS
jgi:hypothetical protein